MNIYNTLVTQRNGVVVILKSKWMALKVGISLLLIVIGIYGAVNSFFVNEQIYFASLILILLGVVFLLYAAINFLTRKYKTSSTSGKSFIVLLTISLIILSVFFIEELF